MSEEKRIDCNRKGQIIVENPGGEYPSIDPGPFNRLTMKIISIHDSINSAGDDFTAKIVPYTFEQMNLIGDVPVLLIEHTTATSQLIWADTILSAYANNNTYDAPADLIADGLIYQYFSVNHVNHVNYASGSRLEGFLLRLKNKNTQGL